MSNMETTSDEIREAVRRRYAAQATRVASPLRIINQADACCGDSACGPVSSDLYSADEAATIPAEAVQASLGCGNPTALASLQPGDVVLDLGSGGGIDVLLAARRVGSTGFVYGLDMTDEMLALGERNREKDGATNVEFLRGFIEDIPLPDESLDVIISNCVINLSADKSRVLSEAFRVLRPGGRLAVSDVVVRGSLPPDVRRDLESWAGCVAGPLQEDEYQRLLLATGFETVEINATRVYDSNVVSSGDCCGSVGREPNGEESEGELISAFVQARKPKV
jgi:SAM-dependent methyltransferase